jgi:hypothetical protein
LRIFNVNDMVLYEQHIFRVNCLEVIVTDLIGKIVDVETPDIIYTGKLIEIGEEEVYIESESGWVVIPADMIVLIREKKG